jgi:hypothetical protein
VFFGIVSDFQSLLDGVCGASWLSEVPGVRLTGHAVAYNFGYGVGDEMDILLAEYKNDA